MIFAIIILVVAFVVASLWLLIIKLDMKKVTKNMLEMQSINTNHRLTTKSFDKDICDFIINVNKLIDAHKHEILELHQDERNMKKAITNLSHDLRTPLTSAIGYLQLMEAENLDPEKRLEYGKIIEKKLRLITSLMNQLVDYTRTQEKLELVLEKINIISLLSDTLAFFYEDFNKAGFHMNVEIPEEAVDIIADRSAMFRVLNNLMQNILKHGDSFCKIRLDKEAKIIEFQNGVKNNEKIDTERLFDRFYTTDIARSNQSTGLGLAIVKNLIEAMGGSIYAEKKDASSLSFLLKLP